MRNFVASMLLMLWQASAAAQLTIPDVVQPYAKIVAGCDCIIPQGAEVTFDWSFSSNVQYEVSENTYRAYLWAPPGDHQAEVLVVIKHYKELWVLEVDPQDPQNKDKWKVVQKKVLDAVDWQRYSKRFKVGGQPGPGPGPGPGPEPPPPGPDPPPGPGPTDPLAKKVHEWLAAVPRQYYSKDKVMKFANVYASVASRAVATSDVQNLEGFLTMTKTENAKVVNNDPAEVEAWRQPFFVPLGKETQAMYQARNLTPNNVKGIADLWQEIAKAMKAAVASGGSETSTNDLLAEAPLTQPPQPVITQAAMAERDLWLEQMYNIRQKLWELDPDLLHQLREEELHNLSRAAAQARNR